MTFRRDVDVSSQTACHPQSLKQNRSRKVSLLCFLLKEAMLSQVSFELFGKKTETSPITQNREMCRSTDFERYIEKESLKVKAFFVRFTGLRTREFLPDYLTLLYPPRINEAAFELDGSKIRPDSPAFVTLHKVVKGGDAIYGSRERVRVWEGIRFEVYMSEERVIKGIFRKDEGDKWKLECECEMEEEGAAEVVVATEGHEATATMARKHRRRKQRIGIECLEEIPEEREEGREIDGGDGETDEGEWEEVKWTAEMESDTEVMGWAVDVGIWVMCLGVGYLVSKASTKTLSSGRRRRTFF